MAGLSMYQAPTVQAEQLQSPKGLEGRPTRPRMHQIRLSSQQWSEGPSGFMSFGDMLHMAGFPMVREEEPPPPPPGLVPHDYVDPPLPPSP
eukprot:2932398-Karenia_brevis.AAC.1